MIIYTWLPLCILASFAQFFILTTVINTSSDPAVDSSKGLKAILIIYIISSFIKVSFFIAFWGELEVLVIIAVVFVIEAMIFYFIYINRFIVLNRLMFKRNRLKNKITDKNKLEHIK